MMSIGELSRRTNVKVPTIRYYEDMGLLMAPERTAGNQRLYDRHGLERLGFIKHARGLGFSIEAIASLIELQDDEGCRCEDAAAIASTQLTSVREKIRQLQSLEKELDRIAHAHEGAEASRECRVLAALSGHNND